MIIDFQIGYSHCFDSYTTIYDRDRSPVFSSFHFALFFLFLSFIIFFYLWILSFYSELHRTVPDFILYTGHPVIDVTSMSRTETGGWFCGYVENLAAFSGCGNSSAHRASLHRYLQHSRYIVDVRVF